MNPRTFNWHPIVFLLLAITLLPGCASLTRGEAVPLALQDQAQIPGFSGVRYRPGYPQDLAAMAREGLESVRREQAYRASQGHSGPLPPAVYLAVSGGGDNGAFGAGLLNGWSAAGDRPSFKLVTGISTGALIAPFAFLGPTYDAQLKEFYTTVSPKDILVPRSLLAAITSDAMADNHPLWKLVEKQVTRDLLEAIAAEYEKGRLLLIGTTDLDARQGVIWNMTKLATSRDPKALELFRTIMIASAAIPGAFPPVLLDVEANGRAYQEMHVDGGALAQVFVYPPALAVAQMARAEHVVRERRLYIIRNSRLDPDWAEVERRTMTIAQRAIASLIHSQGLGDLYRIYLVAERDGVDYHLAYIPPTFNVPHKEEFDTDYMRALFELGYGLAAKGYPWQKLPPGFVSPAANAAVLKPPRPARVAPP